MPQSNARILCSEPTRLGMLCLWRRELLSGSRATVTELTLDHEFLMSSEVTASERALATVALELHAGNGLEVLVGGLGLGYTARQALFSDRVERVEVVEYLPPIIDWFERDLLPLASELKADPRLRIVSGDIYERLAGEPQQTSDLILIDVDHSPDRNLGDANSSFYTEAGLKSAKRHLNDAGILAVWSYAEHSPFAAALNQVFDEVRIEPVTVLNEVTEEEQTDWLFFARK